MISSEKFRFSVSRWAVVKDLAVAQKMAEYIELNTIGVSKDSQLRAAHIMRSITKGYSVGAHASPVVYEKAMPGDAEVYLENQALFHFGSAEMAYRWLRLRSALQSAVRFTVPEFAPEFCNFFGQIRTPTPAFAWLRCIQEADCEQFLKRNGILTRGGVHFGADASFVRLSMIDRRSSFEILLDRLETL
jgi:L-tryptophan--pyruvate aminotransferase